MEANQQTNQQTNQPILDLENIHGFEILSCSPDLTIREAKNVIANSGLNITFPRSNLSVNNLESNKNDNEIVQGQGRTFIMINSEF